MQKKPLILIICIAVVVLAIVLLVVYLAKGGSTDIGNGVVNTVQEADTPTINLSSYPEEETDGDVEISVNASVSGGYEIVSISTPDGKTTGYSGDFKYTVSKNGDYTFTVRASNGKEASQTISIQNISTISADNPYIPTGFTQVDGTTVDTGFTIQDQSGNQFVWVPVESGNLIRVAPSEKYVDDDYSATAFTNSVAKYYGFYIAKYEASQDTVNGIVVAKSIGNTIPWSNVNYEDAYNASRNTATAYNYVDCKTALINSYAWDTTLDWLNKKETNYSTSRNFGNYSNQILASGATQSDIVGGIADMAGNLREWTTEKYDEEIVSSSDTNEVSNSVRTENSDDTSNTTNSTTSSASDLVYRVVRGGSATMDKIANSRIGEISNLKDNYWGFRMVLYKE